MIVKDAIIQKIRGNVFIPTPVTEQSNLYTDLGFDSLSFIVLLMEIEEMYSITFDITEMERCLQIYQLITIVENKLKECDKEND